MKAFLSVINLNRVLNNNKLNMHKNSFQPKTLIGNWHENRFTEEYNEADNKTSNTYIKNPCKHLNN